MKEASIRAKTYWVASGEEARDFLHQRGRFEQLGLPSLVILDLHLPGEGGFEILRYIKTNPSLALRPVIMLTSSAAPDEVNLAYSLGANAFFKKPLTLESYIEMVRIIVQHWLDFAQLPVSGRTISTAQRVSELSTSSSESR